MKYSDFAYLFLTLLLLGPQFSCDSALDINTDPLAATEVDPNLIFTTQFVSISNNRTIEVTGRMGNVVQYYEPIFGVFGSQALGFQSNTFLTGNTWFFLYSGLKDLTLVEIDALQTEPPAHNIAAQSMIFQGFIYYLITAHWEEIPFKEAVDFVTTDPSFDTQEEVLKGIVSMMGEAITLLDQDVVGIRIEAGDLMYNGDLDNWRRFANSLKLKCLMLLANKDQTVASDIAQMFNEPLIDELEYEGELKYLDAPGNYNPLWNTINLYGANFWLGSTTFQEILVSLEDPRLSTFYDESWKTERIGTGDFAPGATPGSYGELEEHSQVSRNILRPDYPDRYMIASEIVLLKAEAVAEGYAPGGMTEADNLYRQGIRLSMEYYNEMPGSIAEADQVAYLETLPPLESLSREEAIEAIQLQLYIANFMRIPEGWIQWRRSKVPELPVPTGSLISDILRRLPYPVDQKAVSEQFPPDKPLDQPMWYEK